MGYTLIRSITGFGLQAAAGFKVQRLATEPVAIIGLLGSRGFLIATVEFELLFGLWFLSGILPKPIRLASLGYLGLLTCVSRYKKALSELHIFRGIAVPDCFTAGSYHPTEGLLLAFYDKSENLTPVMRA